MVQTPIAEEPPIAETDAPEEAKPKTRRRPRARAKAAEIAVTEPAPLEAPPAETAETAEEAPAKPKRKSRAKKAEAAPAETPAETSGPAANDQPEEELGEDGEPRRGGWWQRTFG
jgi:ribonuclease E